MEYLSCEQTHFNGTLSKFIGLYQILDPKTIKYRGYNVYHIAAVLSILYLLLFVPIIFMSGIYIWENDLINSLQNLCISLISVNVCYMGYVIVRHSNKIRDVLAVVRFDFTSCGLRYGSVQGTWRNQSTIYTYMCTVTVTFIMIGCTLYPLMQTDTYFTVKTPNGVLNNYRQNIFNIGVFMSDETYNKHFNLFYLAESLWVICYTYLSNVYNMLLITLSLSMSCQLNVVNTAFESVGHRSPVRYRQPTSTKDTAADKEIVVLNECDLLYDEIIFIIVDHIEVIKKLELFFSIFQNSILSQIIVSSSTLIVVLFSAAVSVTEDHIGSKGTAIKMFSLVIMYIFLLFITSHFIGNIHRHKDAIIFALYSSNWTEMNMKCKKLILMTMKMNNANRRKIQFTNTKIVNLEFFFITMRYCYSMFSVLMNSTQ